MVWTLPTYACAAATRVQEGRWADVVEDLTKVQTPQAIQARAELQELVLSHLNPERGTQKLSAHRSSV